MARDTNTAGRDASRWLGDNCSFIPFAFFQPLPTTFSEGYPFIDIAIRSTLLL